MFTPTPARRHHRAGDPARDPDKKLRTTDPVMHVNPTGRFVTGGPMGDAGLTGRKIIVDTYGGGPPWRWRLLGQGSDEGRSSAAYAARWVAKNVVAAGLADRFEIEVAYGIGIARPLSLVGRVVRHRQDRGRGDPAAIERTSTCGRRRSSRRSTCAARSTSRRPRTATSGARTSTCPGSAPTRRHCWPYAAGMPTPKAAAAPDRERIAVGA